MFDVTLLYKKTNPFGLARDADGLVRALGGRGCTLHLRDPLEPPVTTDLAIHLEEPVYGWMPWAARNVLVVNPEWFREEAWRAYMPRFDRVVFKEAGAAADFVARGLVTGEQAIVLRWGAEAHGALGVGAPTYKAAPPQGTVDTGFVWFLGGSKNKRAAVTPLVSQWQESWPPLRIYTVENLNADLLGVVLPANVRVEVRDLDSQTRLGLARFFRGHVCCSTAEGFGYTAAEAEWLGAFTILNDLPVYVQDYSDSPGVAFVRDTDPVGSLATAIAAFEAADLPALTAPRRAAAAARWERFVASWGGLLETLKKLPAKKLKHLPPILDPASCPPITVVTLLYNRRKFFDLACHSLMIQDYPKDKIEWIIVEDSDDPMEDASDRVMAVAAAAAPVRVEYIPLKGKTAIGKKRNIACERATADIILMMDDDDHYPETSFRRRVAWLTKHPWHPQCVAATTIACYDLVRGISAVNAPPFEIPLSQRVSEATLTFTKRFWEEQPFPNDVQVGEGEGFLVTRSTRGAQRAGQVLEIPPQQIIVAFSHGKNASSRRVPSGADVKPGCFWGFPREFLEFVHGLAGVKVVAETATT